MKYQGIFITGTDTGVGKTVVSAALLSVLRSAGMDAVPMKPVQTGATRRSGRWRSPDLDFCLALAGLQPGPVEYARMAPCCFAKACSPHLAAAVAGRCIRLRRLTACFQTLKARHAMVVVEGVGGVCVPIQGRQTMLDLMGALDLPVVVVARLGLGTINHTLLTLHCLRRAQVRVLGVVFNATRPGRLLYRAGQYQNHCTVGICTRARPLAVYSGSGDIVSRSILSRGGRLPAARGGLAEMVAIVNTVTEE